MIAHVALYNFIILVETKELFSLSTQTISQRDLPVITSSRKRVVSKHCRPR